MPLAHSHSLHFTRAVPFIAVAAVIGGIFVWVSSAAGTPTAFEAESGTLAAPAATVSITGASGGSAVKFSAATPTPTPTSTPGGTRTCPAYPARPNASCIGVPAGTSLTTISGNLSTSANNQIIDSKLITGDVNINHSGVTITNSRIMGRINNSAAKGNLTVTDSDIGADACPASGNPYNLFNGTNYTMLRSHVHNSGADLMGMGGTGTILIQDSIVDHACWYAGDHLDAIQFYAPGDVGNITIDHTVLDARPDNQAGETGNAAIIWADNPGSGSRLTVKNSFFAGGNYTLMLYDAGASSGVVLDFQNNTFVKNSWRYGPCASSNTVPFNGTSGLKFTGNIYDDGSSMPGC